VRILTGSLKGKSLVYPKTCIRPTTELVRAAMFNIIGDKIKNAQVADFFAGAGSLGIEAISRGARIVYFFEKSRLALRYLRKNLDKLDNAVIISGDCFKKIKLFKNEPFDIIIADPPYLKGLANKFIDLVLKYGILTPNGMMVIQHHKQEAIKLSQTLYDLKQKRYGETVLTIIRRENEDCCLSG